MKLYSCFLAIAAISGFLGVSLGAFGAHALKDTISANLMSAYQVGVQYHFYHTLALLLVASLVKNNPSVWLKRAGWGFTLGISLFSGSLYAMALTGVTKLGMITPLGGLAFIFAWLFLFIHAIKES
ncbi:DUF423 domain-containing protein [Catenovulum sp. SM1970]|uniref:DUF423 domain-containing protein n=1 Tax=Marinifaba aquimaris TaxID=2741323 RepID=UPI001573D587|nr:DUF423 domain-containing protein [Marinifaba aquimaris]NTS76000.1 DUF423 domain-containing protein [Marinifaba aquimaris]